MATIDIDTETGEIKYPMRRVTGIEEVRVRAWIELVTLRGEWLTNTESGINYDQIFDGAEDEDIADDVSTRLAAVAGVDAVVEVLVDRETDEDGLTVLTISASVRGTSGEITSVTVGTAT